MKLLRVIGHEDFGCTEFDEQYPNPIDILPKLNANGYFETEESENSEGYEVELWEFGDVDPEFVKFVRLNFIDYEFAKAENFYVIED